MNSKFTTGRALAFSRTPNSSLNQPAYCQSLPRPAAQSSGNRLINLSASCLALWVVASFQPKGGQSPGPVIMCSGDPGVIAQNAPLPAAKPSTGPNSNRHPCSASYGMMRSRWYPSLCSSLTMRIRRCPRRTIALVSMVKLTPCAGARRRPFLICRPYPVVCVARPRLVSENDRAGLVGVESARAAHRARAVPGGCGSGHRPRPCLRQRDRARFG